jgi:hypothetical protein
VWFPVLVGPSSSVPADRRLHALDAMRLVAGALALTLFASFAGAEDAGSQGDPVRARPAPRATQKVPLRVVRVMPESRQALLYDRSRSTHVLAEVGGQIGGYTVEDIDDDEVTLRFQDKQIVLAAPARASERRVAGRPARSASGSTARPNDGGPSDGGPGDGGSNDGPSDAGSSDSGPSDAAAGAGPTPVDPYGEPPIRVVRAPDAPAGPGHAAVASDLRAGEGGVRVVQAPAAPGEPGAAAPTSEPGEPGERIRVVQAPNAPAPATPSNDVASPTLGPAAPSAEAPPAASPAASVAASAPAPASAPASEGAAPPIRVAQAPVPGKAPAKTPYQANKQEIDARAMADVLTGSARDGAKPRLSFGSPPQASEPDVRPSAPTASNPTASNPTASNPAASNPTASNPAASNPAASSPAASNPAASNPTASTSATSANAVISRGEVQAALADFGRLAAAIRGSFSASGVVVNAVGDGTLFQRAGLRAGDVIASVDGVRLRSLDDAANVYARASTAAAMTAQIVRGGKPMTLHVAIR